MDQRIEIINTWTLAKIFEKLEDDNMRILRFQRNSVWERTKVVKLLNSIYSQFPIGTFFLWEADSSIDILRSGSSEFGFPDKPESNKFLFILDGQQQITPFYAVLKGKSFKGIDYGEMPIADNYGMNDFREADFLISIKGDSMALKLNGGHIAACNEIKDFTFSHWKRIFVIFIKNQVIIIIESSRYMTKTQSSYYLTTRPTSLFLAKTEIKPSL